MNEAQLLFASVLVTSGYLIFRVLEAGLLGSFSARYFEWAGRTTERKRLEFALTAEKATLHFKPPTFDGTARTKFEEQIDKVPIDEATGEAIIQGPLYKAWWMETKKALEQRAGEGIVMFRTIDSYFRDTFCKMSQGLASTRAWKEAEEARQACEHEFQEISEWASNLKPGWEQTILMECSKAIDEKQRRVMEQQRKEETRLAEDAQTRQRQRLAERLTASERKFQELNVLKVGDTGSAINDTRTAEELAKAAEIELLSEEEKKTVTKKKTGKKV